MFLLLTAKGDISSLISNILFITKLLGCYLFKDLEKSFRNLNYQSWIQIRGFIALLK